MKLLFTEQKFGLDFLKRKFDVRPQGEVQGQSVSAAVQCIQKGWGREEDGLGEYFAYDKLNEKTLQQLTVDTVKILFFTKGKRLSRHYHVEKAEYFVLVSGLLKVETWDKEGKLCEFTMEPLQRIFIPRGMQHRMTGIEDSILLEVSSEDKVEDSYRIEKGD